MPNKKKLKETDYNMTEDLAPEICHPSTNVGMWMGKLNMSRMRSLLWGSSRMKEMSSF